MNQRYASFESFVYDRLRNALLAGPASVALTPKALELLALFVDRPGKLLSKDFVLETLWPGEDVHEGNLSQQIYTLRKTLSAHGAGDIVQTVPRRGYRFVAEVRNSDAPPAPSARAAPRSRAAAPVTGQRLRALVAAGAALVFTVAYLGVGRSSRQQAASHSAVSALGPLAAREYQLGRYYYDKAPFKELRLAREDFAAVVRLAPRSALGYAGLADTELRFAEFDDPKRVAAHQAAGVKFARQALRLDPSCAEAHDSYASWLDWYGHSPAAATREFDRALALDPNDARAYEYRGVLELFAGRFDSSIADLRQASALAPVSFVITRWLGFAYYYSGHFDTAVAQFRQTLTLEPEDKMSKLHLALSLEQSGRPREALAILEHLPPTAGYFKRAELRAWIAYCRALQGRRREALQEANRIVGSPDKNQVSPSSLAAVYVAAGRPHEAVAFLRASHQIVLTMYSMSNDSSSVVPQYDPRIATLYRAGRLED